VDDPILKCNQNRRHLRTFFKSQKSSLAGKIVPATPEPLNPET